MSKKYLTDCSVVKSTIFVCNFSLKDIQSDTFAILDNVLEFTSLSSNYFEQASLNEP